VPGGRHRGWHLGDLRLAPKEARGRSPLLNAASAIRDQVLTDTLAGGGAERE
jgi:hypothetical protein